LFYISLDLELEPEPEPEPELPIRFLSFSFRHLKCLMHDTCMSLSVANWPKFWLDNSRGQLKMWVAELPPVLPGKGQKSSLEVVFSTVFTIFSLILG
jgi:hypothetical protein